MDEDVKELVAAAKALVDALSFDDNGAMIGGKWMGGNGGLISRETLQRSDALRVVLYRFREEK